MLDRKDSKIMAYIPESKKEAIKSCYHDEDGYWIQLKHGWHASRTDRGCHVIVQDNLRDLRKQITGIEPYPPERTRPVMDVYLPKEAPKPRVISLEELLAQTTRMSREIAMRVLSENLPSYDESRQLMVTTFPATYSEDVRKYLEAEDLEFQTVANGENTVFQIQATREERDSLFELLNFDFDNQEYHEFTLPELDRELQGKLDLLIDRVMNEDAKCSHDDYYTGTVNVKSEFAPLIAEVMQGCGAEVTVTSVSMTREAIETDMTRPDFEVLLDEIGARNPDIKRANTKNSFERDI